MQSHPAIAFRLRNKSGGENRAEMEIPKLCRGRIAAPVCGEGFAEPARPAAAAAAAHRYPAWAGPAELHTAGKRKQNKRNPHGSGSGLALLSFPAGKDPQEPGREGPGQGERKAKRCGRSPRAGFRLAVISVKIRPPSPALLQFQNITHVTFNWHLCL